MTKNKKTDTVKFYLGSAELSTLFTFEYKIGMGSEGQKTGGCIH